MSRQSQRHRTQSLPFPYAEDALEFDLEAYQTDDDAWQPIDLKPGERELDVAPPTDTPPSDAWSTLDLNGTVSVPERIFEHVLPEAERDAPPVALYVAIRCHQTIYRHKASVAEAPVPAGDYEVSIRIDRANVKGEVELRPFLVRSTDRDSDDQYANTRNVRLASTAPYRLVVDAAATDDPPAIDGEAVSFSQHAHLPDGDKLYDVDFRNESRPKLWLNADHPRITDVLQTRGSVGTAPRFRDVVLDEISYGVWTQLIVRACTAIESDGTVAHDWQDTVLETFARGLTDRSNLETAKQDLRSTVDHPDALPELMAAIDDELQAFIDPREQLINLMEEGLQL
jgi:hypothetical protein